MDVKNIAKHFPVFVLILNVEEIKRFKIEDRKQHIFVKKIDNDWKVLKWPIIPDGIFCIAELVSEKCNCSTCHLCFGKKKYSELNV